MTHPTQHCHRPRPRSTRLQGLLLACMGLLAPLAAQADRIQMPQLKAYQQECAACHMAYPPGLLPAASWQRLMDNLPRHFGTDASLDPATLQTLSAYLASNAGSFKKVARNPSPPPEDRISRAAWFVHEHDEVPASAWQRKSIGSASNCAACHVNAAQGSFSEREIRIPR
jgi:mono/diheme cytochrome c family protein